jgi:hypothetical protein
MRSIRSPPESSLLSNNEASDEHTAVQTFDWAGEPRFSIRYVQALIDRRPHPKDAASLCDGRWRC